MLLSEIIMYLIHNVFYLSYVTSANTFNNESTLEQLFNNMMHILLKSHFLKDIIDIVFFFLQFEVWGKI